MRLNNRYIAYILPMLLAGCGKPLTSIESTNIVGCSATYTQDQAFPVLEPYQFVDFLDTPDPRPAAMTRIADGLSPMAPESLVERAIDQAVGRMMATNDRPDERPTLNLLLLSGGGQWGAYGAGFINGWSQFEKEGGDPFMRRENVQFTTGISTGAMQSTLVFAGNGIPELRERADEVLRDNYLPDQQSDILEEYGILSAALGKNAIGNPAPLIKTLKAVINEFAEPVSQEGESKSLLVGMANLKDGRFYIADTPQYLTPDPTSALGRDCYLNVLLGSAAVPAGFPPRFIDGEMYVDGGARWGIFLPLFWKTLDKRTHELGLWDENDTPKFKVKILALINGSLSWPKPPCTEGGACDLPGNDLFSIATESADMLIDTGYNFSTFALKQIADERADYVDIRYALARASELYARQCKKNPDQGQTFNPDFMRCLYEIGFEEGSRQIFSDPFQRHPFGKEN